MVTYHMYFDCLHFTTVLGGSVLADFITTDAEAQNFYGTITKGHNKI